MKSFSDKGYVIIKNAIGKKIIDEIQDIIIKHCGSKFKKIRNLIFVKAYMNLFYIQI